MPEEQPPKTHVQSGGESSGSSGSTPTKKKVTIVEPDDNNNANNNNEQLLKHSAGSGETAPGSANKVKINLKTSKVKSENGDRGTEDTAAAEKKVMPAPVYKVRPEF